MTGRKPELVDCVQVGWVGDRDTQRFDPDELETVLGRVLAERDVKPGKLYQPIRVAITGTSVSPGIFESLAVLGRERSLERIRAAAQRLQAA